MSSSFRPITMKKGELARLYFPESPTSIGTNRLMRWIHNCPPLMKDLSQTDYHRSQKLLTARQVSPGRAVTFRNLQKPITPFFPCRIFATS